MYWCIFIFEIGSMAVPKSMFHIDSVCCFLLLYHSYNGWFSMQQCFLFRMQFNANDEKIELTVKMDLTILKTVNSEKKRFNISKVLGMEV